MHSLNSFGKAESRSRDMVSEKGQLRAPNSWGESMCGKA